MKTASRISVALVSALLIAVPAYAETASYEGDQRPLIAAIDRQEIGRVQQLLDSGADPNDFANTSYAAIHAAAAKGNTRIVDVLLRKGVGVDLRDRDYQQRTPLFFAVDWGHTDMVSFLIRKGANVNARTSHGYSALHMATGTRNSGPIMRLLIDHGADVNATADNRTTVLQSAVQDESSEAFQMLLDRGANPEALNFFGSTVITDAVLSRNEAIVTMLLQRRVSLSHFSSHKGYAPLHWAADKGGVTIVRALLAAGADPKLRSKDGKLPEDIAREQGNREAAELLMRARSTTTR